MAVSFVNNCEHVKHSLHMKLEKKIESSGFNLPHNVPFSTLVPKHSRIRLSVELLQTFLSSLLQCFNVHVFRLWPMKILRFKISERLCSNLSGWPFSAVKMSTYLYKMWFSLRALHWGRHMWPCTFFLPPKMMSRSLESMVWKEELHERNNNSCVRWRHSVGVSYQWVDVGTCGSVSGCWNVTLSIMSDLLQQNNREPHTSVVG